ncbi:UvrD-helicase domain-containing protein [Lipingzhangella sp. LS1_29]|uniref:DNA 3'-5' helicase n=1 Tax=Lipingzhangella rawalii TaxID=2055835 RepID=A0ABU2H361_9ACTN|nr:UvrD-helicase domain-containing protein [Lipingzhangella rawalii]MDS1269743.1 UvrD-helicase domain-containing protein [Lipingzhangella rawalii]
MNPRYPAQPGQEQPPAQPGGGWTPAQLARLLEQPEPTSEQAAVIAAPLEPGVVVAGAGSGKSETMASRVVWLVANGYVRPEQVLGLTFTRKAASELADRVRRRLEQLARTDALPTELSEGEPSVSTYHSYAARIVSDHALREGIEPATRLITPAVSWQLAAQVVGRYDGDMDAITVGPQRVIGAVLELAGELSEHLAEPQDVRDLGSWLRERAAQLPATAAKKARGLLDTQAKREQLLPLVESYVQAKAAREVMDYGDQVALAARIAERHGEVARIERERHRVVLLDEYQDTSHAQLVLLRALFGEGHPVTAVGDPCQSIYGWRGASSGNLVRFPTDFPLGAGRPAPVRQLATSFRNGERVLTVATALSEPLRSETSATTVPRLQPGPQRRARGAVSCGLFNTHQDEAAWIAEQVELALEGSMADAPGPNSTWAPDGQPWPGGERSEALRPGDIAILCRKRSQFPALRQALEHRGIPVEVVGLGGLVAVPEVRDIVATLRILHQPSASAELVRLLTGPRWRLGPRDLVALGRRAAELAEHGRRDLSSAAPGPAGTESTDLLRQTMLDLTAEQGSLADAVEDPGPAENYSELGYARIRQLGGELRSLRGLTSQPLAELIGEVERALGLDIEVAARPGRDPVSARADLDAFVHAAVQFTGNSEDPGLGSFLAYLSSAEDTEHGLDVGRVGTSDSVRLITVHGAKGLQWPLVFVPGLCGGKYPVFPARPQRDPSWTVNERKLPYPLRGDRADLPDLPDVEPRALAEFAEAAKQREKLEERRLAYVAVTRAAFGLVATGHWWGPSSSTTGGRRGPSDFLEEIRAVCATGVGRVAQWTPEPEEDATNPTVTTEEPVPWPPAADIDGADAEPAGWDDAAQPGADWRAGQRSGAALVAAARGAAAPEPGHENATELSPGQRRRLDGWKRDVELLLAHRASHGDATPGAEPVPVELPEHLSVSSLVALAQDPQGLARQIRRPLPKPPTPHTRRGTAFHAWLEERYGQQSLIAPDELPGAADETEDSDGDTVAQDLVELQRRFEDSEWADRVPVEVEVPFETMLGNHLVRGRIDAVFCGPSQAQDLATAPQYEVVDWKTGRAPQGVAEREAVAVQLAAYRMAWADLAGVPEWQVGAAFHYVRDGVTVRPEDLPDAAGLLRLIERVPLLEP